MKRPIVNPLNRKARSTKICFTEDGRARKPHVLVRSSASVDDGRGIDWPRLKGIANRRGLPTKTHEDLVEVLFTDGVTTCEQATSYSGRGAGMGALRTATRRLGGDIDVESEANKGTTLRFAFPLQSVSDAA